MLEQRLINKKQQLNVKNKQSFIFFSIIALIVLVGTFFWINQYSNAQEAAPHLKDTMANLITGDPNKNTFYPCPKRHNISYIWMKGQMPPKYIQFTERCKSNINIVNEQNYHNYVKMWNEKFPQYQIRNHESYPLVLQIEYLKKLHLYFKGGIYSDFDTEIDETCWQNVITDRIIFTNMWDNEGIMLPEENFIKVPRAFDHRLENWIIEHVYETRGYSNRWDQCRMEQCFIMLCQVHNYENTWVKK